MSAGQTSPGSGARGRLYGQRAKSYGSLLTSAVSPVRQKRLEHKVEPGETLQGLSLKYGVSMEQIKRANRLYTNDSIFQKKVLFIPVLTESLSCTYDDELHEEGHQCQQDRVENGPIVSGIREVTEDISPSEYLERMDSLIKQSKQTAIQTCQAKDELIYSTDSGQHKHQESCSSSQGQHATLGLVPSTSTKRTKKLRDREDEIFQL